MPDILIFLLLRVIIMTNLAIFGVANALSIIQLAYIFNLDMCDDSTDLDRTGRNLAVSMAMAASMGGIIQPVAVSFLKLLSPELIPNSH